MDYDDIHGKKGDKKMLDTIPSPSNCPMFNGNGMCMCASMACDDVKDHHCTSMRAAYIYGYKTMAQVATGKVNMLTEKITNALKETAGEQE